MSPCHSTSAHDCTDKQKQDKQSFSGCVCGLLLEGADHREGNNTCAWHQKHLSLLAYLLGQVCHPNGEKRIIKKKKQRNREQKALTKLRALEKNSQRNL